MLQKNFLPIRCNDRVIITTLRSFLGWGSEGAEGAFFCSWFSKSSIFCKAFCKSSLSVGSMGTASPRGSDIPFAGRPFALEGGEELGGLWLCGVSAVSLGLVVGGTALPGLLILFIEASTCCVSWAQNGTTYTGILVKIVYIYMHLYMFFYYFHLTPHYNLYLLSRWSPRKKNIYCFSLVPLHPPRLIT